ncbi:phosphatase PAP2 family protein [Qipengyuania thermophila]|uniref:phosphatase PAP2 family protein n=1 Tax=Qipengyuania thermophila TaxID=2509361 RepID=UPI0013ED92A2|nr:phosphatase PAP2 family protein [Qipengyuania thermophila]
MRRATADPHGAVLLPPRATTTSTAGRRVLAAVLVAQALSAALLVLILSTTGQRLSAEFLPLALLGLGLGGVAGWCRFRMLHWRLGDAALAGALFTSGTLLCGLVACLGLRLGLPLADTALLAADSRLGIDVAAATHAVAARPWASAALFRAYDLSAMLCVAAVVWHLARGHRQGLWALFGTAMLAMQATAALSLLFPARGAAAMLGLETLQGAGLPHGAGTYALAAFERFYLGGELLVRPDDLEGIVCFPSFHTVMALLAAQGFAGTRLRWPATAWAALTIVSTVPMGGHYLTDILGGMAVWLACALAATRLCADAPAVPPRLAWTAPAAAAKGAVPCPTRPSPIAAPLPSSRIPTPARPR